MPGLDFANHDAAAQARWTVWGAPGARRVSSLLSACMHACPQCLPFSLSLAADAASKGLPACSMQGAHAPDASAMCDALRMPIFVHYFESSW